MKLAEDFTPQRVSDKYITFLLELSRCQKCGEAMIKKPKHSDPFPKWFKINFDAQREKARIRLQSNVLMDGRYYVCVECAKAGLADFLCVLCKERKPANKVQSSFGDPPEFLCKDCYGVTPAITWDAISDKLNEDHKYDFYP